MPRSRKRARLWLRPERRDKRGQLTHQATWVILDGQQHIATGCVAREVDEAEKKLATYLAEKYQPSRRERELEAIPVADCLWVYHEHRTARGISNEKAEGGLFVSTNSGARRSYPRYPAKRAAPTLLGPVATAGVAAIWKT